MKEFKAYHKNSDIVKFDRTVHSNGDWCECTYDKNGRELNLKNSDGDWYEYTYDENGNELTYKNSDGVYYLKGKEVTKKEYDSFVNRPLAGTKRIIDGVEYELK